MKSLRSDIIPAVKMITWMLCELLQFLSKPH